MKLIKQFILFLITLILSFFSRANASEVQIPEILSTQTQTVQAEEEKLGIQGNWILKRTYTNTSGTYYDDITFYNGLGYPDQIINIGASAAGNNVVTPVVYDAHMRDDAMVYQPFATNSASLVKESTPLAAQQSYYTSKYGSADGSRAYSQNIYQASSLGRVDGQRKSGSAYTSKNVTCTYGTNAANEVLCLKVTFSTAGKVSDATLSTSYYPASSLYKTTNTDEDGKTSIEFKDKRGNVVLERNLVSGTTYADTYYSYDHLGNLLWTVTPQGSSSLANGGTYNYSHPVASHHSYIYAYDGLNHLVEKKQPGREKENYVRDRAGREMMYQDGNMRQSNQWLCTEYDNLNRVTRKYVTSNRVGNLTPASTGSTTPALPEVKVLYQAMHYGYNTTSEDPATDLPYAATSIVSQLDLANFTHGALKYEKYLLLIEGTQELYKETAYYYNNKGELLQSVTRYPNGNILRTSYRYNFTGDITTKEEVYNGVTKLTNCTYDNRGKLLTETTTINGGAAATVTYAYDDLGRVSGRSYGNGTTETRQYNIQGWATTLSAKRGQSNIYTQTLHYYNPTKGTAALYSGNISEWSSQQASQQQETYGFTYDLQGRLTQSNRYSGTSTPAQNAYTERGITYDKNGNILTLQRYAAALQDNYTYTYNGNRLTSISGTNNGTAIASASYSYDNNGNTVQDGLKGLQISYNILNLPQSVTQSGTTKATYGWFADGTKYSVLDAQSNGYHYIGSLIYSSTAGTTVLESTDFSGGRIVLSGNTQAIHYHHKDHLGSVRAITDNAGAVIEHNAYYPFGGRHTFGQTYAQTTSNRYKFNGKELQTIGGLDLLDYGARMYDTKTARWLVQDPLAEKYYPFSAYNYCVNNPVMFVDPDGKDWFYFSKDGSSKPEWHWREGSTLNTGMKDSNGNDIILSGHSAVVVFNGYLNERLGKGNSLFGEGAILADVTVYGPKGADDIKNYQGYTMSSDPTKWGVIADGEYPVNFDKKGKSGNLQSNWAINNRDKVPARGGKNPSKYRTYDDALVGTFIHSTRDTGYMGNYYSKNWQDLRGISEGCLIITPSIYDKKGNLVKAGWDQYNSQLSGVKKHLLQIFRR